mmetsp:Transcript_12785/g.51299  ORF Transcript_12785/g.51299 Transcript_12785/m.51299 type:complete len:403 (+) Transcript_12785:31-1239(+)
MASDGRDPPASCPRAPSTPKRGALSSLWPPPLRRASSKHSLRTVPIDRSPIAAEPVAAFFTVWPQILVPCNLSIKFWHSEVLLVYRHTGGDDGSSYGVDLFDRGGLVESRITATFFRSADPDHELAYHNVRAIRMRPERGFWLGARWCVRHVDLTRVRADAVRDAIADAIQHRLHPEGFDYHGHCCYNFAEDLMAVLADLDDRESYVSVPLWRTNVCACCAAPTLSTYMRRAGYDAARACLLDQEAAVASSTRHRSSSSWSRWCCCRPFRSSSPSSRPRDDSRDASGTPPTKAAAATPRSDEEEKTVDGAVTTTASPSAVLPTHAPADEQPGGHHRPESTTSSKSTLTTLSTLESVPSKLLIEDAPAADGVTPRNDDDDDAEARSASIGWSYVPERTHSFET